MKPVGNYVLIKPNRTQEELTGDFAKTKSGLYVSWSAMFSKPDTKYYVKEINNLIVKQHQARNETEKREYKKEEQRVRDEMNSVKESEPINDARHTVTDGIVISVSDEMHYSEEPVKGHLKYDTDNELQEGDVVIFHYMESMNARKEGRMYDGNLIIEYSSIFCAIRSGEVIPVNGYLLVEPVMESASKLIWTEENPSETKGVIRYAGTPLRKYRPIGKDETVWDEIAPVIEKENEKITIQFKIPEVGDMVIFKDFNAIKLQYPLHAVLNKNLLRMQRRDIVAIQTTAELNIGC